MGWGRILSLSLVAVLLACFGVFIAELPRRGQAILPVAAGSGIVVPTGGAARIATGLDLLARSGGRLLVTGVHPDTPLSAVLARSKGPPAGCCVDLDYDANNTAGNAAAAARWVNERGLRQVHLVTSWYHMPRSLLLFRRALPGITITAHPVFLAQAADYAWWLDVGAWRLVVVEFGKYAWALIQPLFDENGAG